MNVLKASFFSQNVSLYIFNSLSVSVARAPSCVDKHDELDDESYELFVSVHLRLYWEFIRIDLFFVKLSEVDLLGACHVDSLLRAVCYLCNHLTDNPGDIWAWIQTCIKL